MKNKNKILYQVLIIFIALFSVWFWQKDKIIHEVIEKDGTYTLKSTLVTFQDGQKRAGVSVSTKIDKKEKGRFFMTESGETHPATFENIDLMEQSHEEHIHDLTNLSISKK